MPSHHVNANEADQASQVLGNEYYKKLQRELKERQQVQTVQRDNSGEGTTVESDQKRVAAITAGAKSGSLPTQDRFGDSVQIQSFRWDRGADGEFELSTRRETPLVTSVDLTGKNVEAAKSIGYKIDLNDKLGQLKQALMQNVVQSRSANFFVSKYAQFKVGMLVRLLAVLGVPPEEITALQHKAIQDAIQENINLMAENLYSMELTELVYGLGKKSRRNLRIFKEVQKQLMAQMAILGQKGYWTETRITEERLKQLARIQDEFKKERENLAYQYEFYFKSLNG